MLAEPEGLSSPQERQRPSPHLGLRRDRTEATILCTSLPRPRPQPVFLGDPTAPRSASGARFPDDVSGGDTGLETARKAERVCVRNDTRTDPPGKGKRPIAV